MRRVLRWGASLFFAGMVVGYIAMTVADELETSDWPATP